MMTRDRKVLATSGSLSSTPGVRQLAAAFGGLSEGAARGKLPPGSLEGSNDFNKSGYGGPCPPIGRHRYFFTLYALDTSLSDVDSPSRSELEAAMKGHVIEKTETIGTYEHPR